MAFLTAKNKNWQLEDLQQVDLAVYLKKLILLVGKSQ